MRPGLTVRTADSGHVDMTPCAFVLRSLPPGAVWALLAVAGAIVVPLELAAQKLSQPLRIAFMADMFVDVQPTDAVAAIRVWSAELSRRSDNPEAVPASEVVPSIEAMGAALRAGKADIVVLRATDFLHLRKHADVRPLLATRSGPFAQTRAVLIVNPKAGASSIDDLKGKGLLLLATPAGSTGRLWLETEVLRRGYQTLEAFFGEVRTVSKPSQAVLPVFFSQATACVVDDQSLKLIGELNPQVSRQVSVLATSPPLLAAVICMRADFPSERRTRLLAAIFAVGEDARGQQAMALFKSSGMVPFTPALMGTMEELTAQHATLTASLARRAAAPGARSTRP